MGMLCALREKEEGRERERERGRKREWLFEVAMKVVTKSRNLKSLVEVVV